MGKKGKLRRFFPGSNSARGFFSFFSEIAGPAISRVLVLKGGPGCGKSTFMRKIGRALQEDGYDLEYHHCASDSLSLDGLVVPALGVALIDGTFPHVLDPPSPGVIGEIIDLGRFWNASALQEKKGQIFKLQAEIKRLFAQAHRILAITGAYRDILESYYQTEGILDWGAQDRLTLRLSEDILAGETKGGRGLVRRLFASAITPQGCVHYLADLIEPLARVYLFNGEYSTGKSRVIERVLEETLRRGFYVEAYHCALDPEKVDHMVIPELSIAIINNFMPHCITATRVCRNIDSGEFIADLPPALQAEKDSFTAKYTQNLQDALSFLERARSAYQELEGYYIPQMDFTAVDYLCQETLASILEKRGYSAGAQDDPG